MRRDRLNGERSGRLGLIGKDFMDMRIKMILGIVGCLLLVSGCGFGPEEAEATSTPTVLPVSTFTPTPEPAATAVDVAVAENSPEAEIATPTAATGILPTVTASASAPISSTESVTNESALSETTVLGVLPTVTPDAASDDVASDESADVSTTAQLTVIVDAANVRAGPDINHQPIGTALRDAVFDVVGRNEASDWWQVCCFNEQPGWLFESVVEVQNIESVAVVNVPPPVIPTPAPVAEADVEADDQVAEAPAAESAPPEPETVSEAAPEVAPVENDSSGTAGSFDPNSQYHIVHYRVLGFDDNNGGIFNRGGQQLIFLTVLDGGGNPMDGVVVKDAVGDNLNVVTGSKGPGKAEIKMDWDPYKLYVANDPGGPVTSQVSNQMNNPYPHIPDVVGMLGPVDNEYAICPTVDDRCSPPFYSAHWSYEITFQKVR